MILGSYFTKNYFNQVSYTFKRWRDFYDYKVSSFLLALTKLNVSIAYFYVQKSTERIVYLFPSTVFKQCLLLVVHHYI